uniref:Uncharacterized protein n=1 Tax=Rhipicephalus appendiculatus TaxID=34631 RepID=A0A131YB02_RHIAP
MFVTKNSKPGMPIYQMINYHILCTLCHAQHAVKLVPGSICRKPLSVTIPNLSYISRFLGCCANVLRLFNTCLMCFACLLWEKAELKQKVSVVQVRLYIVRHMSVSGK